MGRKKSPGIPVEASPGDEPAMPRELVLDSFILGRSVGRDDDQVFEAQQIMYDAWESQTRRERIALAKKALTISADCADAYVVLAEEMARSLEAAVELYRKGVEAGERALGKSVFKKDAGHFWGLIETRPYMRAREGLANTLLGLGRLDESIEHYRDMLRLNPNDNQGVRYVLMQCLIGMSRDDEAEKLFARYEKDSSAFWVYSRVLLDFRRHGDSPEARESLSKAVKENRYVPAYLLGRKKMPRTLPSFYGFGDRNEAVVFVTECAAAWTATPGALEWLAVRMDAQKTAK